MLHSHWGRLDDAWLTVTRRFAGLAWVALTAGMVTGAHWAYQELGWGGLWAWDPVENASLLPWLATTAFLHSAIVTERRRRLHAWTAALALAAFALGLVGVYLTRSGVTGSVHAFAEARAIGYVFLAAVVGVVVGSGLLLSRRWRHLGDGWRTQDAATREAALLANNVILLSALVVVTAGTLAPLVSEAIGAARFTVAPGFFAALTALPALLALALAGIGPGSTLDPQPCGPSSRRVHAKADGSPAARHGRIRRRLGVVMCMPSVFVHRSCSSPRQRPASPWRCRRRRPFASATAAGHWPPASPTSASRSPFSVLPDQPPGARSPDRSAKARR